MRALVLSLILVCLPATASGADILQENLPQQTYDMNSAEPGHLYFATEKPGRVVRAPMLKTDIHMSVSGPIVRTRVVQHFTNDSTAWVEGLYTYPLPKGSAVDTLEMKVGDRLIKGEIKEKAEAKRTFEAAKRAGKRASLVVQKRPNIFSTQLANIGPGETIEITIEYQDLIEPRDNLFELRFPMVVRPRYNPGIPLDDTQARAGWGFDTDQVPDGRGLTQPLVIAQGKIHNPVTLSIDLAAGFDMANLESPSHAVTINSDGRTAKVELAEGPVPADQDFILRWRPNANEAPQVGHLKEASGEGMHHLLMFIPPETDGHSTADLVSRDLTIVLDKSGSMSGQAIRQAKSAVRRALMRLTDADRINLIAFDSFVRPLFPRTQQATTKVIEQALDFLDDIEADGGTEMSAALGLALPGGSSDEENAASTSLQQIIFITDGAVGNEKALMQQIKTGLGDARLFTVGIGSAPNSYFMEEAAHFGRGAYLNIAMNDDVHTAMATLFNKIESPQITEIKINLPEGLDEQDVQMVPARVADLYAGEPIVLALRTDKPMKGDIVVTGNFQGTPWEAKIDARGGGNGTGVSGLWARRAIKAVNRNHIGRYSEEDRKAQRQKILDIALPYNLVSDFTSLVAVDHTPARPARTPLFRRETPANLPAGMDWGQRKVMTLTSGLLTAETVAARDRLAQSVRPRGTATPAQLYMLIGLALLVLASLLMLADRVVRRATKCG
ncbi:MAG: marine proteobacterial sortase target protein [Alphaproteobacteria bacterium]|nr:marine proteobacterial sortase target protein [Alphaproteobacteria bacterium]